MKYFSILICYFLILCQASASITKDDLKSIFLTSNELGPLSIENLEIIENVLNETGQQEVINRLLVKLKLNSIHELSSVIHSCELPLDTLGLYQRGSTQSYTQTLSNEVAPTNLEVFWQEASILEAINKSYQYEVQNNGVFASLVLREWPIICIRPKLELGKALGVFIHEVEHFLGDEFLEFKALQFNDENDYIEKELMRSGGEYSAYTEEAKYLSELQDRFDYKLSSSLGTNYQNFLQTGDDEKLKKMILNELGYYKRFVNNYRAQMVNALNSSRNGLRMLYDYLDLYEENLRVSNYNFEVNLSNQNVFKHNMNYYQSLGDQEGYQVEKDNLIKAIKEADKNQSEIRFYQNIIFLSNDLIKNSTFYLEELEAHFTTSENKSGIITSIKKN